MTKIIQDFHQPGTEFLSNFYRYHALHTVEHRYQAAKTLSFTDRKLVFSQKTPGEAKRLGRLVHLRPDWDSVKDDVMLLLLRRKFSYPVMRQKLLATGDAFLIEGNKWHDTYWGICRCGRVKCKDSQNKLGVMLMQVRKELRSL